jgi:hypothetical protein
MRTVRPCPKMGTTLPCPGVAFCTYWQTRRGVIPERSVTRTKLHWRRRMGPMAPAGAGRTARA